MKTANLFIYTALLLLTSQCALAVSIGLSPGNINFNNVLKGGYAERPITISSPSFDDAVVSYQRARGFAMQSSHEWLARRGAHAEACRRACFSTPYRVQVTRGFAYAGGRAYA